MNEGSKETTEHGLDETTPLSSEQQTKLDIFVCGLCNIACNEAGDFLRHKISRKETYLVTHSLFSCIN